MQDRTLKIYQGSTLIRQYTEDSASYRQLCNYLGIPRNLNSMQEKSQTQPTRATRYAILDRLVKEVRMTSFYEGSENYKLYELNSADAWLAHPKHYLTPEKDYLEVEFRKIEAVVAICLQGRGCNAQWIKLFKLSYSNNGNQYYFLSDGQQFEGNSDQKTIKVIKIPKFKAKFLRFIPTSFHGYKTCRFDVLIQS